MKVFLSSLFFLFVFSFTPLFAQDCEIFLKAASKDFKNMYNFKTKSSSSIVTAYGLKTMISYERYKECVNSNRHSEIIKSNEELLKSNKEILKAIKSLKQ